MAFRKKRDERFTGNCASTWGFEMTSSDPFSTELRVFEQHRAQWVRLHPGEYVAIQDNVIEGFFQSYADALMAGLKKFGVRKSFLVKQVWTTEPVYVVS